MPNRVAVVVLGAGAIGSAVAAALVQAGQRPMIATRSPFERLDVTLADDRVTVDLDSIASPDQAPPADAVFLAVKAHQTDGAADWLRALVDATTTVFILQNGVEHLTRLTPHVPAEAHLVPVVVALPAERSAPGVVAVGGRSSLTVAAGRGTDVLTTLLRGSFIDVKPTDDWTTTAWIKLMLNAASGGICVIAQSDNGLFATDDEAAELAIELMNEVATVGRAEGAELPETLPRSIMEHLQGRGGGHLSSIVADRLNGAPTEWDARNAAVARIAARHDIEVPLNRLLTTLVRLGEPS